MSSCLGPTGIPNSSQTNSQQPAVSLGFSQSLCYFLRSIILLLPQCLQSRLCLRKLSSPVLGLFRNLQNIQSKKSYFFMAKAFVINLTWVYLRIRIRWVKEDTTFHFFFFFKTVFAFVFWVALILTGSRLGFSDAFQQCLYN